MAQQITIAIKQGQTLRLVFKTGWNLTGYSVSSQLRENYGLGAVIANLECDRVLNPATNVLEWVNVAILGTVSSALKVGSQGYCFDLKLVSPNGDVAITPTINVDVEIAATWN